MSLTPNFGFNIPTGTDTVNLLTQCYPNFTSLDTILQAIKESGVSTAAATKVGTTHQLVRTVADCNIFRFVATANYASGDTFTVDGSPVTATAVNGTSLPAGAFVINQSVLCILNGAVLTVAVAGASDAQNIGYDNTGSGLTASNVQDAIDEVVGDIPAGFAATAITYDNSGSGLSATDVQDAIDELASGSGGIEHGTYEIWENANKGTAFSAQSISITHDAVTSADAFIIVCETSLNEGNCAQWYEIDTDVISGIKTMNVYVDARYYRSFEISRTGDTLSIDFRAGYVGGTSDNTVMVPVRVLAMIHNT